MIFIVDYGRILPVVAGFGDKLKRRDENIMKRTSKKGFTIVELVIVIAVIAILAAVMIPTFSSVIGKARDSAALQEATAAYKAALAEALADDGDATGTVEDINGFKFEFTDAEGKDATVEPPADFGYEVTIEDGVVTVVDATE